MRIAERAIAFSFYHCAQLKFEQKATIFRPSKFSKFRWSGFAAYYGKLWAFFDKCNYFFQIIDKISFSCYYVAQKVYVWKTFLPHNINYVVFLFLTSLESWVLFLRSVNFVRFMRCLSERVVSYPFNTEANRVSEVVFCVRFRFHTMFVKGFCEIFSKKLFNTAVNRAFVSALYAPFRFPLYKDG